MSVLIFVAGMFLGLVAGAAACLTLIRQELTAHIAPRLELLDLRVANMQRRIDETPL